MNGEQLKIRVHLCAIPSKLILVLCCLSLWLTSCNDEVFVKRFQVSATKFDMNGEGDSAVISVNNSDWTIFGVERNAFQDTIVISGDLYNKDGQMVMTDVSFSYIENSKFGKMVYSSHVNGLTITTDTEKRLCVYTHENLSDTNFDFTIWVGDNYKSIPLYFSQKPSGGFTFDHIEYNLKSESCYTDYKSQEIIHHNMTGVDIDMVYYVFSGVSMKTVFNSDDKKMFNYLGDSHRMEVPTGVINGTLQYSGNMVQFNRDVNHNVSDLNDVTKQVTLPQGKSIIRKNIEYLYFESSFTLYLRNNATNNMKIVNGSLQCQMPTGNYYLFINDRWIK